MVCGCGLTAPAVPADHCASDPAEHHIAAIAGEALYAIICSGLNHSQQLTCIPSFTSLSHCAVKDLKASPAAQLTAAASLVRVYLHEMCMTAASWQGHIGSDRQGAMPQHLAAAAKQGVFETALSSLCDAGLVSATRACHEYGTPAQTDARHAERLMLLKP